MYVYRFRLLNDDVEGFVRDYEIAAKQTFKDFHDIINQSIAGLRPDELASFYICDRKWNKLKEITLIDMDADDFKGEVNDEEQNLYLTSQKDIMEQSVIKDYINDPHQRIIYEQQDFLRLHTFYVELMKSVEGKEDTSYPVCVHRSGELPKPAAGIPDDDFEDFAPEEESDFGEDMYDEEDLGDLSTDLSDDLGL